MSKKEQSRNKLTQAVRDMLDDGESLDQLTTREIAQKANVAIGAVNYHFGSKDNLIGTVVYDFIYQRIQPMLQNTDENECPSDRIKKIFHLSLQIGLKYPAIARVPSIHALKTGDLTVQEMLLPIMRNVFKNKKTELQIRQVTYCMVSALQCSFLQLDAYARFAGIQSNDHEGYARAIDEIIDLFLNA